MKPIVAIVDRPNVGKSSFFNRVTGTKKALVDDFPGVTRDRHYSDAVWNGINFTLVYTGGFQDDTESHTFSLILQVSAKKHGYQKNLKSFPLLKH